MQWNWIDVRDVAKMHILALRTPEAGGHRMLATSEPLIFQDLRTSASLLCTILSTDHSAVDIANAMTPPPYPKMAKGNPGSGTASGIVQTIQLKAEKQREIFGMGITHRFRTKEEMMKDTLNRFKALGFEI
jgi:hypothetical protein